MLVAIDGARCAVEAMVERDAVGAVEATAVCSAHVPFRVADAHFAVFKAICLPRRECGQFFRLARCAAAAWRGAG